MADDGERVGELIGVIGYMFIACFESLKKQNVLKAESPVLNLGLVMAILIEWAQGLIDGYDGFDGNVNWVYRVIELAEEAHIKLTGPKTITEIVMQLKSGDKPSASSMKKYKDVNWATKVSFQPSQVQSFESDLTAQKILQSIRHWGFSRRYWWFPVRHY